MTVRTSLALWLATLALAGCAAQAYPPAIQAGSSCAACGMSIDNMRFGCEQRVLGSWRAYDSIECMLRESEASHESFLADYDTQTLHAADSMWVVRGRIASPMGGGLAGFLDRDQAVDVAASTEGEVLKLEALIAESGSDAP